MNIQQLRHALKVKWLLYYQQNRPWLTQIRVWGTFEGKRRPCSSFILATVTNLEPKVIEMLPFIVQLSSNPDQIVAALGLNFNPDEELKAVKNPQNLQTSPVSNGVAPPIQTAVRQYSNGNGNGVKPIQPIYKPAERPPQSLVSNLPTWVDESCKGIMKDEG